MYVNGVSKEERDLWALRDNMYEVTHRIIAERVDYTRGNYEYSEVYPCKCGQNSMAVTYSKIEMGSPLNEIVEIKCLDLDLRDCKMASAGLNFKDALTSWNNRVPGIKEK